MAPDDPEGDLDAEAGDAMQALTEAMIRVVETQLGELGRDKGEAAALAFAFGGISACARHLALAMGAAYCIEYLDDIAKPFRDFLTAHGGAGVGVRQ